jgi:hypothetical protein
MDDVQEPAPGPAVRLIFEYDGDDVRLVSQQAVDVAVPGVDLAEVTHPGHYVETRNEENDPLSRVPVREAFSTSAEVFPQQPGEPITRVDVAKPRGAFTVVVPAGAEATRVALLHVRPPADTEAARPAARATTPTPGERQVVELATFPLTAGQQRSEDTDEHS